MEKLVKLRVVEPEVSPWAANNVFVPKSDGGVWVTSDFRRLHNAAIADCFIEDVREVLDLLGSKKGFSTFDFKDGFARRVGGRIPTADRSTYCNGSSATHEVTTRP